MCLFTNWTERLTLLFWSIFDIIFQTPDTLAVPMATVSFPDFRPNVDARDKFPETLSTFGFTFNKGGQLRKVDPETKEPTDEPFKFDVSDDQDYNQRRYEALGEIISDYMYDLMETDMKLHRIDVPLREDFAKKTFIYGTKDVMINPERLLILIQGSGVVRAGQWARSLIINDGLETGSQIPYINQARILGYAVLVLNPNDNKRVFGGVPVPIKNSADPIQHFDYVWRTYIKDAKARHIAIVAHSYGGVVCVNMASQYFSDFNNRVFGIAMTDSVHSFSGQKMPSKVLNYLRKVSRNWVADSSAVDTPLYTPADEITRVSAGHRNHCMTSSSAMKSVFDFLEERYKRVAGKHEL